MLDIPNIIIGKWNGNKYKVLDKIGHGGIGEVYKVKDEHGNIRAVKISEDINSITREYNAMKEFRDLKGIPKVYEIDDYVNLTKNITFYFFIMEHIEGKNLKEFIKSYNIRLREAVGIGLVLLKIFKAIKNKGYMYTDIKLENILIDTEICNITIVDFGSVINREWGIREYTPTYNMMSWGIGETYSHDEATVFGVAMIIVIMMLKKEFNPLVHKITDVISKIRKLKIHSKIERVLIDGLSVKYSDIDSYENELKQLLINLRKHSLNKKERIDVINVLFIVSVSIFIFVTIIAINII